MGERPKLLDLPHGYQTVIDEADWPLVEGLTIYRGTNGYVYFSTWANGRSNPQTLHRYLLAPPRGTHVDHINGDKLDNRRSNLRVVSPSLNGANRHHLNRNNRSGTRGVSFRPDLSRGRPWQAHIMAGRRSKHLGLFATREEAIEARRRSEAELFGEACP